MIPQRQEKIDLNNWIFIGIIVLVPFNYLKEIFSIFAIYIDVPGLKLLKDLYILTFTIFLLFHLMLYPKLARLSFYVLFSLSSLSLIGIMHTEHGLLGIVSGLRSILPVFFVALVCARRTSIHPFVFDSLSLLLWLQLFLQVYEMFFGQARWEGLASAGISLRNAGMFSYPSTSGFFALSFFILVCELNFRKKNLTFRVFISLLLSGAVAPLLIFFLYAAMKRRANVFSYIVAIPSILASFFVLTQARGVADIIYISLGSRYRIFEMIHDEVGLISAGFGFYSNAGASLISGPTIDSTFNYVLGSFGFFALLGLLIGFLVTFVKNLFSEEGNAFLISIFGSMFVVSIFEVYPANIILVFALLTRIKFQHYGQKRP
jgi:hypothetical protein